MFTPVTKPTSRNWSMDNPRGKETYDQNTITYDDPNIFYDGFDNHIWTRVAKPTGGSAVTILVGMTLGLIIPLTNAVERNISGDSWTRVAKPTS